MDVKKVKMRVYYASDKTKMKAFANVLGEEFECLVESCPPTFLCERERLVVIGMTLKDEVSDQLRLFCRTMNLQRASNVALFIDGEKDSKELKIIKKILEDAGTNLIDKYYYVNGGNFLQRRPSIKERANIVRWVRGIIDGL